MLIEKANVEKNILNGTTVLLTGGGGGIGFETARALAFLGADVIIAEIDTQKGSFAEKTVNAELQSERVCFYSIDVSNKSEIEKLYEFIKKKYRFLDVIINNATVTPIGAVDKTSIEDWENSFSVNLKAPVMLIQKFLPSMKKRKRGLLVFVSSSGASPYMGAYEVFKTAQTELCNTIVMELENTGVRAFTIGPGLVKTATAKKAIEVVSRNMGMTTDDFYAMNSSFILDAESAGTGFALSILKANEYNGQEIGSIQVLTDYGITFNAQTSANAAGDEPDAANTQINFRKVFKTFSEQYCGWKKMNVFQRQWVLRDFKKVMGLSAEQVLERLKTIGNNSEEGGFQNLSNEVQLFEKLKDYWKRQLKLLQGFEKNKIKLDEQTQIILGWIDDIENLISSR